MEVNIGGQTVINSIQIGNHNTVVLDSKQSQFLDSYWLELEELLNKQMQTNDLLQEQIKVVEEIRGYVKKKDEVGFKKLLKGKGSDLIINILGGVITDGLRKFLVNLSG